MEILFVEWDGLISDILFPCREFMTEEEYKSNQWQDEYSYVTNINVTRVENYDRFCDWLRFRGWNEYIMQNVQKKYNEFIANHNMV